MKKKISRILATLLTASLVISGTTTVFAAQSGDVNHSGNQYHWAISGTENNRTFTVTGADGQKRFNAYAFCFDGIADPDYPLYEMQTLDFSGSGLESLDIDLDMEGYSYGTEILKLPALSTDDLCWDQYEWENLKNITVEAGGDYTAPGGVLIQEGEGLVWYPSDRDAETYTVPDGVKWIRHRGFWYASNLTSVTLPNTLERIGLDAFMWCLDLRNISIPASVTKIEDSDTDDNGTTYFCGVTAFNGCESLGAINVDPGNPNYSSDSGILFSKDGKTLYFFPSGKDTPDHNYSVPDNVTKLAMNCFTGSSLKSVTIGKDVDFCPGIFGFKNSDEGCSITDVYYSGSEAEWNSKWNERNFSLLEDWSFDDCYLPKVHFNSTRKMEDLAANERKNDTAAKTERTQVYGDTVKMECQKSGKNGKKKTFSVTGLNKMSGIQKFTVNAGVKFNAEDLKGLDIKKVTISFNNADGTSVEGTAKDVKRLFSVNKKGVVNVKPETKYKKYASYTLMIPVDACTLCLKVVNVDFDKKGLKNKKITALTGEGSSVSVNLFQMVGKTVQKDESEFLSADWTVDGKIAVTTTDSTKPVQSKKKKMNVYLSPDYRTITISNPGTVTGGSVKVTAEINGKKYNATVNIKVPKNKK
ncbi:MAG: leucine-rich repeat domain-containing protein [Lachnospiraceae bacterium]|nr:leucine-rich repeat domain-containing protein [Lachnospiraceae bacterium]